MILGIFLYFFEKYFYKLIKNNLLKFVIFK